ncbi:hypothetical protein PENTCL1PPCAC_2099, partial [Pristionchus entomophagus]
FQKMTTAHRPTFNPARGGSGRAEGDLSKLSQQYSSKDMPSHKTLKYRQTGQGTGDELRRRDLRRELEDKERTVRDKKSNKDGGSSSSKRPRMEEIEASAIDADEPYEENSGSDSDSDEDDTAALMEELAKIKKERANEKAKKDEEEEKEKEKIRKGQVLVGNPLLNLTTAADSEGGFKVKRRWDDDVVFKNCAKGQDEKKEANFINDAIRSEFHRKFMDRYVK